MEPQRSFARVVAAFALAAASGTAFAFDPANPIPQSIAKGAIAIELESIATGVISPNYLTHAGDGTDRLFVVQQPGQIGIIENGALLPAPFLDVSARLPALGLFGLDFDERGLLGLAFHPDFANNGKLYTFTSENVDGPADFDNIHPLPPLVPEAGEIDPRRHQSVVAEWQVNPADANAVEPGSRREVLRIDNPQFNHNGGAINFGPDGNLFIAVGDGGGRDDAVEGHGPVGNGQTAGNVLGTILRIDVDGDDSANGQYGIPGDNPFVLDAARPDETFAIGFRNPFRFSFDPVTGDLIAADVGQDDIEEIDIVTPGGNFGWSAKEGSFAFTPETIAGAGSSVSDDLSNVPLGLIDPVLEYDHDEGISVIGGFVYRGSAIPELTGKYVFGDFSNAGFFVPGGRLFYGDLDTGLIQEFMIGLDDRSLDLFVKGFGLDAAGEIYLLADLGLGANSAFGEVLKIVAAPVPLPPALWLFGVALGAIVARRRYHNP